jgi:poly(3-hydroxybutyrate) depolymerase
LIVFCCDAIIDPKETTLSGLSSGAYMATQYQFAHSSTVKGAAIFAGGPYYCAQNLLNNAMMQCMYALSPIPLATLELYARTQASTGNIDPLSHLANHRVFLFSGVQDATVKPAVVRTLETMYSNMGVTNMKSNFALAAAHTFPTIDEGNSCTLSYTPYISACNYDGAGVALEAMYDTLKPPVEAPLTNIIAIDQSRFTGGATLASLSLGPEAYLYVPTGCKDRATPCKLHVALHGCQQYKNAIGMKYVELTGFNNWGEANNIFILYPQATSSQFSPQNPNGCWDWWGYVNANFATKNGPQIRFLYNLINYVIQTH